VSIARMITAVRKVAVEAADIGLLAPGCWHRKPGGSHQSREGREKATGVRVENRLSLRQALLNAPDSMTKKGLRDRAMLAMLLGRGLRPVPRSLPLRWPTFSRGITDGASSIGSRA